ncbi:MAG: hypothetical protein JSU94_19045 [Phycisphaerales bacterium]|nr:MAG: hypothetical protein JSU94_19045 [Phycisphaerales bacterium]
MKQRHIATAAVMIATALFSCCHADIWTDTVIKDGDDYDYLYVHDSPPAHTLVLMIGGSVYDLFALDACTITIKGGRVSDLYAKNESTVNISGGTIGDVMSYDSSTVNITGGKIPNGLQSEHSSRVNISGGTIGSFVYVADNSVLNITGGDIEDYLLAHDSSAVNIHGRNLQYDPDSTVPNPWGPGRWEGGKITGNWTNGAAFEIDLVDNLGGTGSNNTFSHVVLHEAAPPTIIYVDADAHGADEGSSWPNAYRYLQDALLTASPQDEIRVAQGLYKPDRGAGQIPGDREAAFNLPDAVVLKGGYAGLGEPDPDARDIDKHLTVLSGDLLGNDVEVNAPGDLPTDPSRAENSYHVVTAEDVGAGAVLDGFTITAGNANRDWADYHLEDNAGGGMRIDSAAPLIRCCTFSRNSAFAEEAGGCGGLAVAGGAPTLEGCTFIGNVAATGIPDHGGGNGGAMCASGDTTIVDCTFIANHAVGNDGGGLCVGSEGTCRITDCLFQKNTARTHAGAIYSYGNLILSGCNFVENSALNGNAGALHTLISPALLTDCVFLNNHAGRAAGAMETISPDKTIINCLFAGNVAQGAAGALLIWPVGQKTIRNCTFAGNLASSGRAVACASHDHRSSTVELTNCILRNGGDEIANLDGSTITITHTNIQGGPAAAHDPDNAIVWGPGNLDADPLFAHPADDDYHLRSQAGRWDPATRAWVQDELTSPCIDAGDPMTLIGYEPFPNGGIVNMGAYGGTARASKSYFGESVCENIVAGDINGDCKVNFDDFCIMALHWLEVYQP